MCGWQVKLCDPLVTHELYLSALEVQHDKALYKFTLLSFKNRRGVQGDHLEKPKMSIVRKYHDASWPCEIRRAFPDFVAHLRPTQAAVTHVMFNSIIDRHTCTMLLTLLQPKT